MAKKKLSKDLTHAQLVSMVLALRDELSSTEVERCSIFESGSIYADTDFEVSPEDLVPDLTPRPPVPDTSWRRSRR